MVFVSLGTFDLPFTRPLTEIDQAVKTGHIAEPVIVQCGPAEYESAHMKLVPFFSGAEMEKMYADASYIICQAGIGSIMMGLKKRKKVIVTPRLKNLYEVQDDHQLEILHAFAKNNYILPWYEEKLTTVLEKLDAFTPTEYPFQEEKISDAILDFLNKK